MRCFTNQRYWNGSKTDALKLLHKRCLCSIRKVEQVANILVLAKKEAVIRTNYFNAKEVFEWPYLFDVEMLIEKRLERNTIMRMITKSDKIISINKNYHEYISLRACEKRVIIWKLNKFVLNENSTKTSWEI